MNKKIFITIVISCAAVLALAWIVAINAKSPAEKQLILINQATQMMDNGIYIRAVPLLEEAAAFEAVHTEKAESELKRVYLALIENRGFTRRYTALLEKQMNRRNAAPEVFIEAAKFHLNTSKIAEALAVLRKGIERTSSPEIIELYEKSRYAYELSRLRYDYITAMFYGTASVQNEGKWGIARSDGTLIIPNIYDQISTFYQNSAVVRNGREIYAIDANSNRIAVAETGITDFKNFSEARIPLLTIDGWRRASNDLELGAKSFEYIGMYSDNYAAAKIGGRWGVIDLRTNWLIEPEYEGIIKDELGRSFGQRAVFVRNAGFVQLYTNGNRADELFDDARPFSDEGYAAVMRGGKWGFIDTDGKVKIDFKFDEALSFSGHLAAVKVDGYWGYINTKGEIVIAAEFYEAKSFSQGSAPVKTERGWQFLTLIEFKGGPTL
ncbi:MAG: WG repeat-containing protein [Oscillospiraceae bacterium]|nr:WG repeat-containing protein [Oscillospiraceae bacterium]MCL2278877.1 WG repeat-containing protein [Oscillospiraceae bacterium]